MLENVIGGAGIAPVVLQLAAHVIQLQCPCRARQLGDGGEDGGSPVEGIAGRLDIAGPGLADCQLLQQLGVVIIRARVLQGHSDLGGGATAIPLLGKGHRQAVVPEKEPAISRRITRKVQVFAEVLFRLVPFAGVAVRAGKALYDTCRLLLVAQLPEILERFFVELDRARVVADVGVYCAVSIVDHGDQIALPEIQGYPVGALQLLQRRVVLLQQAEGEREFLLGENIQPAGVNIQGLPRNVAENLYPAAELPAVYFDDSRIGLQPQYEFRTRAGDSGRRRMFDVLLELVIHEQGLVGLCTTKAVPELGFTVCRLVGRGHAVKPSENAGGIAVHGLLHPDELAAEAAGVYLGEGVQ